MRDNRWILVDQQLEELLLVVPDDWGLVMATDEQLSGVQVDVLLVESLGLTEAGSILPKFEHYCSKFRVQKFSRSIKTNLFFFFFYISIKNCNKRCCMMNL
jgi:hypothetical protein